MRLRRRFYDRLLEWKARGARECLLVNGARQVGKTYIIEQFGIAEYESYLYINFLKDPQLKAIFEGSLEPTEIYKRISLYMSNVRLVPGGTLIFLDEVQACKKARTALKFLAMDGRFDVVASGSLLGIHYKGADDAPPEETSVPVGYEREVHMHALDFEEYLWACGVGTEAIDTLRDYARTAERLPDQVLKRYQDLLREYLVVGGMPEVVSTFMDTHNFEEAFSAQEKILNAYEDDVDKYASNVDKPKIMRLYQSVPRQLAKENTKFQYSKVERGGSARKFGTAIDWLIDAGLVRDVHNVSVPLLPLAAYEEPSEFKIYVTDTGLLTHLFGRETQVALVRNTLKGPAKGGIYENLVFDLLHKRGVEVRYYKRANNAQEIEFLMERDGAVVPVEVKSSKGATVSLNTFMEQYEPRVAYKLVDGNSGRDGAKVTLPQFMGMFL